MEQNTIIEQNIVFTSPKRLLSWLLWIFIALAILNLIAVVSGYSQSELLNKVINGGFITPSEAASNDTRQAAIGFAQTALIVISGIIFLIWIHRANKNLTALKVIGLRFTPGWAVGWFFIPFMSLFRPYEVVSEIWKASDPGIASTDTTAMNNPKSSAIVGWWWAFFLISNFLSQLAVRLMLSGDSASELITSTYICMVTDFIDVFGIIITIIMVKNITEFQETKSRQGAFHAGGAVPLQNS